MKTITAAGSLKDGVVTWTKDSDPWWMKTLLRLHTVNQLGELNPRGLKIYTWLRARFDRNNTRK